MAAVHGLRRVVVLENDEASGVTADELRKSALEKGLIQEGDIVLSPGDESYNDLEDIPSINGVKVEGDKKLEDYGIEKTEMTEYSTAEIIDIWNNIMND